MFEAVDGEDGEDCVFMDVEILEFEAGIAGWDGWWFEDLCVFGKFLEEAESNTEDVFIRMLLGQNVKDETNHEYKGRVAWA